MTGLVCGVNGLSLQAGGGANTLTETCNWTGWTCHGVHPTCPGMQAWAWVGHSWVHPRLCRWTLVHPWLSLEAWLRLVDPGWNLWTLMCLVDPRWYPWLSRVHSRPVHRGLARYTGQGGARGAHDGVDRGETCGSGSPGERGHTSCPSAAVRCTRLRSLLG